jgi:hypothetical protein
VLSRTLWEYLFTQNTGDYFMWEDLFTQHAEEYCMLSTVGRFMYTQYWGIVYVELFCVKQIFHSAQHKVIPSILFK